MRVAKQSAPTTQGYQELVHARRTPTGGLVIVYRSAKRRARGWAPVVLSEIRFTAEEVAILRHATNDEETTP